MEDASAGCLTIIRDISQYSSYPWERCPQPVQSALQARGGSGPAVLTALECFLQVTGQGLTPRCFRTKEFLDIVPCFIGAIYSPRFMSATMRLRQRYVATLLKVAEGAMATVGTRLASFRPRSAGPTDAISALVIEFERLTLVQSAVDIWRAWPACNITGRTYWLRLRPIYETLGPGWTARFYEVVRTWYAGSRSHSVPGLTEFARFIAIREGVTPSALQDTYYVATFWREFWAYYKLERSPRVKSRQLIADWLNPWTRFVTDVVTASGLIAPPATEFPGPQRLGSRETAFNIGATTPSDSLGILLVDVPQQLTDRAALELLLQRIPESLQRVRCWAETQAKLQYELYRRRRRLARIGSVRAPIQVRAGLNNGEEWKVNRANPDHLANAAATYEAYGHTIEDDQRVSLLYPTPLVQTARELGLPVTTSLLAHASILVLEHPIITPSFLETLELFDKQGKLVGLRKLDGGYYLIGYKYRKGHTHAEQHVKLNRKSLRVVWQLMVITRPLRNYLKVRFDENWRNLFLTCGQGFGYPKRLSRFASDTSIKERLNELATQLVRHSGISASVASSVAQRFSLKSLRVTVGIQALIDSHSERSVSVVLGHESFSPALLARYLPAPLVAFFRARWIRAFQTNLVVLVTQGTEHALSATGFESMDELNEFMSNNALPGLADALSQAAESPEEEERSCGKLFFNANEITLTYLCCAVNALHDSKASHDAVVLYWGEFGKYMLQHLEARQGLDPNLDACLSRAKARATGSNLRRVFDV